MHADSPASGGALTSSDLTQQAARHEGIAPGVRHPGLVLAFLSIAQFMVFLDGMLLS